MNKKISEKTWNKAERAYQLNLKISQALGEYFKTEKFSTSEFMITKPNKEGKSYISICFKDESNLPTNQ